MLIFFLFCQSILDRGAKLLFWKLILSVMSRVLAISNQAPNTKSIYENYLYSLFCLIFNTYTESILPLPCPFLQDVFTVGPKFPLCMHPFLQCPSLYPLYWSLTLRHHLTKPAQSVNGVSRKEVKIEKTISNTVT